MKRVKRHRNRIDDIGELYARLEMDLEEQAALVAEVSELRSVSLRITEEAYEDLERFTDRYGGSRSAFAAELLETAIAQLVRLESDATPDEVAEVAQ